MSHYAPDFDGIQKSSVTGYLYHVPEMLSYYAARPRDHQFANLPLLTFLAELSLNWNGPSIGLGDISLKDASAPPTHHTHVHGSCVDLYVFHRNGLQRQDRSNVVTMNDPETIYDRPQTRRLAETIRDVATQGGYQVVQFLYDDPEVRNAWGRITTSSHRPHQDHFHLQLHQNYARKGKEAPVIKQALLQQKYGF